MALTTFNLLNLVAKIEAQVTLPASHNPGAVNAAHRLTQVSGWGVSRSLRADDPNRDPDPVAIVARELTIASGEATIDLTAAPIIGAESGGAPAATEDLTGKNLIAAFFSTERASGDNAAPIVVKAHATNGYDLFGVDSATPGFIDVPPGAACVFIFNTAARDPVAAADKIIHFEGTDGDTIRVILVFEA